MSKEIKYKSIRPKDKVGDPKVADIRCLQYSPEGKISYMLSYQDNYKELLQSDKGMSKPQGGNLIGNYAQHSKTPLNKQL